MRIILIGNYTLDKQESMQRFCTMLQHGFQNRGVDIEIWKPTIVFGRFFNSTQQGYAKWFGYIDKWLMYPIILKIKLSKKKYKNPNIRFHICDHSNAPYLKYLPKGKTGITCHDVLAIRGAMGFNDASAPASRTGKIFQHWILKNLKKAKVLAAVSHFTLKQLNELTLGENKSQKKWMVIHNAFNASFEPMPKEKRNPLLLAMGINANEPFILHVGTEHPRKNRNFLLHIIDELGASWSGKICFAGMPLDTKLLEIAKQLNVQDRIISAVKPSHEGLVALYSAAEAFIFPSLSEGFGWPVIEAQACGTPVIASNFEPMPEVSGSAALHEHPKDAKAFAKALLALKDETYRKQLVDAGYKNIERFELKHMIDDYLKLYDLDADE